MSFFLLDSQILKSYSENGSNFFDNGSISLYNEGLSEDSFEFNQNINENFLGKKHQDPIIEDENISKELFNNKSNIYNNSNTLVNIYNINNTNNIFNNYKNENNDAGTQKDKTYKKEAIEYKRGEQKDNFSIKLLKEINNYIIEKINTKIKSNSYNFKLFRPNYNVFTHNTNLIDLYIFLDLKFRNILTLTPQIKGALDKLLIKLKIKKQYKRKQVSLTKKNKKKYKDAIRFLELNDIDEKMETSENEYSLIELLKNKGIKGRNEEVLYKKDLDIVSDLLIKNNSKKSYLLQEKNKNNIKKLEEINKLDEINELNMTLKEIIIMFYKTKQFEEFNKKVEKIKKCFMSSKNYKYSLLNNDGFIKMIEDDCGLTFDKKEKIKKLTEYFNDKDLNEKELENYEKCNFG